tara:strand:- start:3499 stop:4317 length:819 start_codon:yes stop_codon:yes gene_type:complete
MNCEDSTLLQALILAMVQGGTEFLPISSSAHLILVSDLMGWSDQGLVFDVAVHLGTLFAVLVYFRNDLALLIREWLGSLTRQRRTESSKLAWLLLCASIPVGIVGFLAEEFVAGYLRSSAVIAAATMVFALVLWLADQRGEQKLSLLELNFKRALWIGCGQCLALIPGTSRSGITISVGLLCGLDRRAASKFSFLLSIPTIAGSGLLQANSLLNDGAAGEVDPVMLLMALLVALVVGVLCIHAFLSLIDRLGFLPFIVYRLVLGVCLYLWVT